MRSEIELKQYERDKHFMRHARLTAEMVKCLSRKVGSVLVRENHILATGYNGPAKGIPSCLYRDNKGEYNNVVQSNICPRQRMRFKSGDGMQWCAAVHSERNCLLQCAKFGISTEGSTLYAWCGMPCIDCAKEIINAGVKRVVCLENIEYIKKGLGLQSGEQFEMAGVKVDFISEKEIEEKESI